MLNYKFKNVLSDIIDNAYSEADYPNNKFKKFYLEIVNKEMKSIHGRYFPMDKKIQIFNLSRPTGHIVATSIHEVSHHIDHCIRDNSDHKKEFYTIMQKLLITAMGMSIITQEDILTANDSADKERLIRYFGDIDTWDIPHFEYKEDVLTIKVFNCFSIKDKLKNRGYAYSAAEQCWVKDIDRNSEDDEKVFLSTIIDMKNVKIICGNEIDIEAVCYICVLNSYDHREFLKENGYLWNGYSVKKNSWTKKVLAKDKDIELAKVEELPGVKICLVSRK